MIDFLFKAEIISFFVFFLYVLFYLWEKAYISYTHFRNYLFPKKIISGEEVEWEVKIETVQIDNEMKNHHIDTYEKDDIWLEEKQKLAELTRKVKVCIGKWDYDIAKSLVIEWMLIDKFNKELNLELASLYVLENNYLKAEYIYKDLLLVHDDDFDVLKKLAYALSMQEKYDLAIEIYKKALEKNGSDYDITNMLGSLTYYNSNYLESIDYLRRCLKERGKDKDNLYLLAASYKNIGKLEDAANVLRRILELDPYNETIKKELEMIENSWIINE